MKLENKKAIVTGAGRGIGRAVAIAFAREGADVLVNYYDNADAAREVVETINNIGRKAIAVKTDVSSYRDVQAMVDKAAKDLGGVDILVNNAGISQPELLLKMTEKSWDRIIDVHMKGTFNCVRAAARCMKKQKWGRIINVTSPAGLFGTVGQINYASAKAGIVGFTKSVSRELGRHGITVNAICPGITCTEMTSALREDELLKKQYLSRIQLGRFAEPEEIAPAFVFLASDDAGYITGQVLGVDGGYIG
jgi:3-oxoacyl-[acyl-carrier protein] reductase